MKHFLGHVPASVMVEGGEGLGREETPSSSLPRVPPSRDTCKALSAVFFWGINIDDGGR